MKAKISDIEIRKGYYLELLMLLLIVLFRYSGEKGLILFRAGKVIDLSKNFNNQTADGL